MELNIQDKKIELIQWLTTLNDSDVIQSIIELKKMETKDWWNYISEAEKKSIELGVINSKKGNTISHSDVKKLYEKWL